MNTNFGSLKAQQDYPFSDADFRLIAEVAKVRFGLDLASSKKPLVYSRLAKRLRALNLHDFAGYCRKLQDDQAADEIAHFLSALTTNVTHFFREMHHFQFLADTLAPHLIAKAKSVRRFEFGQRRVLQAKKRIVLLQLFCLLNRGSPISIFASWRPTLIQK